jgi:hypothetical protein
MKRIDLGQTIGILANLGVIAGIVFLAVELRQNNELLLAQASYSQYNINRERRLTRIENIDAALKESSGEPLSPRETAILNLINNDTLDAYRWQYREYRAGRLPDDFLDLRVWRDVWRSNAGLRAVFEEDRSRLEPDFVSFIDEQILDR